jgi:hypothetical protein
LGEGGGKNERAQIRTDFPVARKRRHFASTRLHSIMESRGPRRPRLQPSLRNRGDRRTYDVDFVPAVGTAMEQLNGHFVPIKTMLDWAEAQDSPVLLINSDIELRMAFWEIERARWLSDSGLCYFTRYNHRGDLARAWREPYGLDAFLLHGRDAKLFPSSFLSMGRPCWDYWLPYTFARNGRPLHSVEYPAAFHRQHP